MSTRFHATSTHREKYEPAMNLTEQANADAYFEELVEYNMTFGHTTRERAEFIERQNLGYFAGYFDHETRLRVERLFHCEHPVFGDARKGELSPEAIFKLGIEQGRKHADGEPTDLPVGQGRYGE